MNPSVQSPFSNRLLPLAVVLLLGLLIWVSDYAPWAMRLTMGTLFCSIIYFREESSLERWIAISIIALGTLLSLLLPADFLSLR
ncbi:MAG: hypothetical protein ONB48_07000 [candidate division KSB1 bacterium]|nr:hypothetical protein [candidate division KSB1 bacterium]MDZ7273290.1 hypothetical protein [candidate division KSB1 bacterium]MDZ7285392.1 hypothetical protein [candidate division KSB1 bacterium]MDZ7298424.1 hypothetical protein [candidate division KSB1 bacterium]MDZ7307689.1 hypothetical protein [candidate division KSB1 bacterium]